MLRFFRSRPVEATDAELLERFRRTGQADWLVQLYDRHLELTYGLCLRYLGEETRAEDAVMAIFEELLRKVPEHEIGHFRNWLHTFVRNHCLMQLRRERRSPLENTADGLMQFAENGHLTEESTAFTGEAEGDELRDCLERLPPDQRRCIELFYLEEHSYKGIAEMTQLDLGRVRSHIQNGRRNLRLCLEQKAKTK